MCSQLKYFAWLCVVLFPTVRGAFTESRLFLSSRGRNRVATSSQRNLLSWFSSKKQLPWSSKDNSGAEDKEDVWGDDTPKPKAGSNKTIGSSSGGGGGTSNKSGLGGVAGIMDSMENFKTAQQVGKMTNSLVQELASTTVEGIAVEGKVKVYFDGQQQPMGVQIDDAYLKTVDSTDLTTALTAAMKDAYSKSAERMDDKMKSFYVDLGLK